MSQRVMATVLSNKEIAPGFFELWLHAPEIVEEAQPGQFLHVNVASDLAHDPFLRRPFSISTIDKGAGRLSLLIKVVGRGTQMLSDREEGGYLDILGPLGNGFHVDSDMKRIVIVGGGIGVAPLLGLGQYVLKEGIQVHSFIGALNADSVLCSNDFTRCSQTCTITTDDGSIGRKGFVTNALEDFLKEEEVDGIFACGPEAMLKKVTHLAKVHKVPCQISLEARMACGIGACLGCTIGTKRDGRYLKVCVDGPVFSGEEVAWDE
jgi:dihydroorotate dehydrogenase electron transfer subunit